MLIFLLGIAAGFAITRKMEDRRYAPQLAALDQQLVEMEITLSKLATPCKLTWEHPTADGVGMIRMYVCNELGLLSKTDTT